jgi:hypothetical protein
MAVAIPAPSTPRSILKGGTWTPSTAAAASSTPSTSAKRNVTFSASTARPVSAESSLEVDEDEDDASVFASLVSRRRTSRASAATTTTTGTRDSFSTAVDGADSSRGELLDSDLFDVSAPVGFSADLEPQSTLADSILAPDRVERSSFSRNYSRASTSTSAADFQWERSSKSFVDAQPDASRATVFFDANQSAVSVVSPVDEHL